MTQVRKVSRNVMTQLTGLPQPGYADSDMNTIYLANDLNKEAEKIVLKHEQNHIDKGETDGFWGAIIGAAGSLLGGQQANQAASEQSALNAQATENASARQLEMQRRSMEELQRQYELARRDTLAGRQTGIGAMNFLNQALLPGQYSSYTNPNNAFTPDYLQPMQYGVDGEGIRITPQGDFRSPYNIDRNIDYYKDRYSDFGLGGNLLEPEDPLNFFGMQDTGSYSLGEYTPSEGQRMSQYTGGQGFTAKGGPEWARRGTVGPSVGGDQTPPWTQRGTVGPAVQGGQMPDFMPTAFEPGEFTADPGYAFRVSEGEKGMQNQLAASGLNASGRALKEMERFRQGLGSQEYGNFFNRELTKYQQTEQDKQNYLSRIMQMAGFGPQSVNTVASAGQSTAGNVANVNANTGNALSNIAMQGGANAANIAGQRAANWNNAIQGGLSNFTAYQQQQNMNNMFNQPRNWSGVGGVYQGSQQDRMLADQWNNF